MKKTAIRLMIITLISKLFGFSRDIILSYFYGASRVSDAYLISLTIPEVVFGFVTMGISTGYIPIYSTISKKEGEKSSLRFTNNLINAVLVLSGLFIIIAFIFAPQLVQLFASGFDNKTVDLAMSLTRISLFSIFFSAMIALLSSFLQIKGNFEIPALIGFPLNIITVLSIILSFYTNVYILGFGILIAIISQVVLLIPSVRKKGFRYKFILDFKDKNLMRMIQIAVPVIIGVSVNQINILVDRTIASNIAIGGISALNYAYMLVFFVQSLFVLPITQIMYPNISKMVADNDFDKMKATINESISLISLIVIPASFGTILFATPVVGLLYGRGNFGAEAIEMTSQALMFYGVGIIGFALREILSRSFYSMQDTRTPMINASITVGLSVVLNFILSKYLGIGGLALSTSISAIVTSGLLMIQLRRKIGKLGLRAVGISFIKILIASTIMSFIAGYAYQLLINRTIAVFALFGAVVIGLIVYFIMVYILKVDEIRILITNIKITIHSFTNKPKG